jgi:adenylate cyclase class 2
MPVEIEAKIKVDDLAPFRRKLEQLGAERVGSVLEVNAFFDTDDRTLLAEDKGLRLRQNRDLATNQDEYVVTFKGPRLHGAVKSRNEIEVDVGEGKSVVELFEQLGYHLTLSFEKRRHSWKLDDCKVELDEMPLLGAYVEVEGPSVASVQAVRAKLGLADKPDEKASYIAMLMTYLQERGRGHEKQVKFGDAAGTDHAG